MRRGNLRHRRLSLTCRSLAGALAIAVCSACDHAPTRDPIQDAVDATPADKVGRYSFPDKIILANRTTFNFSNCRILLEGGITGELQQLPSGATMTIMRSRFHPYVDADEFFRVGHQPGRMACDTPDGPRSVTFAGTDVDKTVIVPNQR